jgi:alkanesulfonate monooxygenase SsuD/methylene tetrahydromethanopterin reductase-like flavin-dependent oxidoreductase (luciferase family)
MGTFYHDYMHRIGFGKESDLIREAYLNKDREKAAKLVTDEMVSCMSIIGSPAQCKQQMDEFFNAGVDEIRLVFNEDNHDHIMESINSLAPYI